MILKHFQWSVEYKELPLNLSPSYCIIHWFLLMVDDSATTVVV